MNNQNESWMNNPKLSGMDMSKLAMLGQLAEQGKGKSPQELLPFLMSAASRNKESNLQFSSQEMETIIQVLKAGKSQEEIQRMDRMLQLIKMCAEPLFSAFLFKIFQNTLPEQHQSLGDCLFSYAASVSCKMAFLYSCLVFHGAANKHGSYRKFFCTALRTCKSGNRQCRICTRRKGAALCHFSGTGLTDSAVLFQRVLLYLDRFSFRFIGIGHKALFQHIRSPLAH